MPSAAAIINQLRALGDREIARHSQRFFKTGKGEYGEGDRFLGIRVPVIRQCVREHRELPLEQVLEILHSPYHEARLMALLILVEQYARAKTEKAREVIYRAYLQHTDRINNWDLVDSSAHKIVGRHLASRDRAQLHRLARSPSLWERRIAVIATFHFIAQGEFDDALAVAERLLVDPEDLLHKAVGWQLREIGKRNRTLEEQFLDRHYRTMPRTMLRYAIEKFPEKQRQAYLHGQR